MNRANPSRPPLPELLLAARAIDDETIARLHTAAKEEADQAVATAMQEARPTPADIEKFTYAPSEVDAVYPHDYTGLPYES